MNLSIIHSFIADQRRAKKILHDKLQVPTNIKAIDWAADYSRIKHEYQSSPFAEVFIPHGYGLELSINDLYIDFDYSRDGRPDGFDAWRLYVYITAGQFENSDSDDQFCKRIFAWIEQLNLQERITQHDNLYYLV